MFRIIYAILTGLVAAALLHIIIILALPYASDRDTFSRVLAAGPAQQFSPYNAADDNNPLMRVAVCAFDASLRPVHLLASGDVPFWSLTVHDSNNDEIFSMNDRTAAGGEMDVAIASPAGASAIRRDMPMALENAIIIESALPRGYAVLRTMVPSASFGEKAAAFLSAASCASLQRF